MGNVLRVIRRDIKRLIKAPAALVVVAALLVLPSVYTWYNVVAFWDPYGNTGSLRVGVVNQDAGAWSSVTGSINVGGRIVEELDSNDQLDWVQEDYRTALNDLKAGDIYAVYVIPENFSACLLSPLSGTVERPQLKYYTNEKLGPVSPKLTDSGATGLDQTINSMFVTTVSDVAVQDLDRALHSAEEDAAASQQGVAAHVDEARSAVNQLHEALRTLDQAAVQAQDTAASAGKSLDNAAMLVSDASKSLQDLSSEINAVQRSLAGTTSTAIPALSKVLADASQVTAKTSAAANSFVPYAGTAQTRVDNAVSQVQPLVDTLGNLSQDLQSIADALPADSTVKASAEQAAQKLAERSSQLQTQVDDATALSAQITATSQSAADAAQSLNTTVQQASTAFQQYSNSLFGTTAPAVNSSLAQMSVACTGLSTAISDLDGVIQQAQLALKQLNGILGNGRTTVSQTDALISDLQSDLDTLSADVLLLGQSGAIADLASESTLNAQSIADFMGSPTELETVQLYHPNVYGASMAPLFMNLTFWIGAFMLVIILRLEVDSEGLKKLTLAQRYLGRFGLFAILAVFQAIICCAGVLLLGVQAANVPGLFFAAAVSSLAYLSIIYALSVTLRHIGKGLCIVLVFAQIPGGSGLYPLELTSRFFQDIYPILPFSYGIDAMREAIGGFYGTYYLHDLVVLGAFFFGLMALGLLVSPLMSNVVRMVARQVRETDLFNGEDVVTPSRPYRFSQMVHVLLDREDFRVNLEQRYERFTRRYPLFIRASLILGVGVSVILVMLFALGTAGKAILLSIILLWLAALCVFLVVVESLRYSFERQLHMEQMSDDLLLGFYADRDAVLHSTEAMTSRSTPDNGSANETDEADRIEKHAEEDEDELIATANSSADDPADLKIPAAEGPTDAEEIPYA